MIKVFVIAAFLLLLAFLAAYEMYDAVFCYPPKRRPDAHCIPDSELYKAHRDRMLECVEDMERTSFEEIRILSTDGLQLYGRLYQFGKDAPLIIFFHGFHGIYAWDGYGFFRLCKENGINILMADARAHGKSGGNVITFGIMERCDCKSWAEYAMKRFGKDTDVFLAGVSMGAASVMMSSELGLPENVRALIEDCGYSEPAAIIKETIQAMKLPVAPFYQLIKFCAHVFGHFDLESADAVQALEQSAIPTLFIHGEQDSIVPLSMEEELYKACKAKKRRVQIAGANHANSAMTDYETYEKEILQFIAQIV